MELHVQGLYHGQRNGYNLTALLAERLASQSAKWEGRVRDPIGVDLYFSYENYK